MRATRVLAVPGERHHAVRERHVGVRVVLYVAERLSSLLLGFVGRYAKLRGARVARERRMTLTISKALRRARACMRKPRIARKKGSPSRKPVSASLMTRSTPIGATWSQSSMTSWPSPLATLVSHVITDVPEVPARKAQQRATTDRMMSG